MLRMSDYDEFVEDKWVPSEGGRKEDKMRCGLALAEESGEAAGKVKKWLRGDIAAGKLTLDEHKDQLMKELGDILFYCVKMAHLHDCTLADIIKGNMAKLDDRKKRGTLLGSGDDR